MKAIWRNTVLAESDDTIDIEGTHYFPPDSVRADLFRDSNSRSNTPGLGLASYKHVIVDGKVNEDAAWYFPDPVEEAAHIKDYVAFWKGVEVKK